MLNGIYVYYTSLMGRVQLLYRLYEQSWVELYSMESPMDETPCGPINDCMSL